jgi:ATP-dependent Clp protease adapter protein ClpS
MTQLSKSLDRWLQVTKHDIEVNQYGPASLVMLRNLVPDPNVHSALIRLGAHPTVILRDLDTAISRDAKHIEEGTELVVSMLAQAFSHGVLSTIPIVQPLHMMVQLFQEPLVKAQLEKVQISKYEFVWQVSHGAMSQIGWRSRLVDKWRLAAMPALAEGQRHIVMYNDHYSPKAFVQHILQMYLAIAQGDASKLMTHIHKRRWARIATKSIGEANHIVAAISHDARASGFPLRLSVFPPSPKARVVAN